jgi:hypothetical protein
MTQTETQPEKPTREAHVRPEDVKKIGGAQSIDDKVETWQRQLEATESRGDSDTKDNVAYYGALIVAFLAGSLMSGFSMGGGDGGGGVFIGMVDIVGAGVLF